VAVYALGDRVPVIAETAYIHPDATVIGSVTIGEFSSVWPSTVLRGDYGEIRIGDRTSVQDGSVLHATYDLWTTVGSDCVIGHNAHLEGCTIEDKALVGSGSIVLHRAIVRTGGLVGAGAVVAGGTEVPTGAMALGIPAKIKPDCVTPEMIQLAVDVYVDNAKRYPKELRRID
jgi:carbonic anhydrase/acetyltransferase-like protein (isoleucine patch superfamily)